ncbi:Gfo/Idh/MocA family oxidoreductase [Paenibacillus sp. MWE-103]|uniref:Gfo/Idh/MocA family oxidoreductase n=1 Tax=Paenibacillus artemisiicola TaxID=1172618 RepID=A0ABS3WAH4_9BACL|nr:Gfo/Idh/MocA family oxidoreductase [Paenibacillus artemisiicola]MBO7745329.1 Gfo/Idh/MocA family oxidoreductase [Paenibacillus artemisiicola]
MRRLKVGLIGLGEVAQITHLPILEQLADRYEIAALCDISPSLLAALGEKHRVANLYTDYAALAAQADLDAVFVLNSDEYHADSAIQALKNGKHVLIEKPMTLNAADADAMIRARDEAGVQVMVGYMRRYAPAFTEALEEIKTLGPIQYAKIRDIIGPNRKIIDQSSRVYRFSDIPQDKMEERWTRRAAMIRDAIGDVPQDVYNAYGLLAGLNSHDLSAMRELLGMPKRVVSATQWNGGGYIAATLEFDGYYATFETGVDEQCRFDASIEVFGKCKQLTVKYDTPYIRHLPTTLEVKETIGEAYHEYVKRPTLKDPYTVELETFYDVVANGAAPKTTPEDYKQDLELFKMIAQALIACGR